MQVEMEVTQGSGQVALARSCSISIKRGSTITREEEEEKKKMKAKGKAMAMAQRHELLRWRIEWRAEKVSESENERGRNPRGGDPFSRAVGLPHFSQLSAAKEDKSSQMKEALTAP